jgi:hypothetical protein
MKQTLLLLRHEDSPKQFKRVMSFVRSNWKIIISAIAIIGVKVLIENFENNKLGNGKN